jgi:hypothetical protein
VSDHHTAPQAASQFTPDAIRHAEFPSNGDGLEPKAVHRYMSALADHLEQVANTPPDRATITAQTVGIISRAQLLAEQAVADAEQYSRDLIETARTQYQELLRRAEVAGQPDAAAAAVGGYDHQIPEIEYVRTYTRVAYSQLRAVLDALAEQVDRLGQLPELPGEASSNDHQAPVGTADVHRPALPAADTFNRPVAHVTSDA